MRRLFFALLALAPAVAHAQTASTPHLIWDYGSNLSLSSGARLLMQQGSAAAPYTYTTPQQILNSGFSASFGNLSANALNNTQIGNTTPSTGAFSTLSASGLSTLTGGVAFGNTATSTGILSGAGMSLNLDSGAASFGTVGVSGTANLTGGGTFGGTFGGALNLQADVTALNYLTPGNTNTLSGNTAPTPIANFGVNWVGSSTIANNTSLFNMGIGAAGDNAAIPSGGRSELLIRSNYGGTSFSGGRTGMLAQLELNTASTLANPTDGLVGYGSKVIVNVNAGGVSSGFGVTQFGYGDFFGSDPWVDCQTGATYLNECTGTEIDAALQSGASAASFSIEQLVLTSDHATHGTVSDLGWALVAQTGASAGVRNGMIVGSYGSQWPIDPNGYVFQAQIGQNDSTNPATAAGGFDLNQMVASGSGAVGSGFYWRSPGVQLISTGAQIGYGLISNNASGLLIDATYEQMTGTPTVAAGGSNFTSHDVACDAYGDCVVVTATGGAVTAVSSVLTRGWQTSPPSNPVAFTAKTRTGSAVGSGLTLNLTWTAETQTTIGSSGHVTDLAAATVLAPNLPTSAPATHCALWVNAGVINQTTCP